MWNCKRNLDIGILSYDCLVKLYRQGNSPQEEEGCSQNSNSWWQKTAGLTKEDGSAQHHRDRRGFSSQVNIIRDDGTVIHFNNPRVQGSLSTNTFAIMGHIENKQLSEMLPGILSQLGADYLSSLRKLVGQFPRECEYTHKVKHSVTVLGWVLGPIQDAFFSLQVSLEKLGFVIFSRTTQSHVHNITYSLWMENI